MKITMPLYQTAVRGVLLGVGTFRQTAHGAILTRTNQATTATTPARDLAQRRFAVESHRATSSAETMHAFLARRLPTLSNNQPPRPPRRFELSATTPQINPRDLLPQRATLRSFPP